jgi:hypothetical protein
MAKDISYIPANEGDALVWELLHITDKFAIEISISSLNDILYLGYPSVLMVWNALIKTHNDTTSTHKTGLKLLIKLSSEKAVDNPPRVSPQAISLQVLAMLSSYRMCAIGISQEKGFSDLLFALLAATSICILDKGYCIWIVRRMVEASQDLARKIALNTRAMTQLFSVLSERVALAAAYDNCPCRPRRASTAMLFQRKPAAPDIRRRPLSGRATIKAKASAASDASNGGARVIDADALRSAGPARRLQVAPDSAALAQQPASAVRARAAASPPYIRNLSALKAPASRPAITTAAGPPVTSAAARLVYAPPQPATVGAMGKGQQGGRGGAAGMWPWFGVSAQLLATASVDVSGLDPDEGLRLEGNCAAALAALATDGVSAERQGQRPDVGEWVAALAWLLRHAAGSARLHACRSVCACCSKCVQSFWFVFA